MTAVVEADAESFVALCQYAESHDYGVPFRESEPQIRFEEGFPDEIIALQTGYPAASTKWNKQSIWELYREMEAQANPNLPSYTLVRDFIEATRSYYIPISKDGSEPDGIDVTKDYQDELLHHAKVYWEGVRFQYKDLSGYALYRVYEILLALPFRHRLGDLTLAASYTMKHSQDGKDALAKVLVQYAASALAVRSYPTGTEIDNHPTFATAVAVVLSQRCV
jgi:hypothetical protein